MPFKSYTSCVQPEDYHDAPTYLEAVLADLAVLAVAPEIIGPTLMYEIETALDYMLNGKLVCLGGDRCAVGQIVGFETVSDKSFPENIDNDFSFNLMLYPNTIEDFIGTEFDKSYDLAKGSEQGILITEQPNMPIPHHPQDSTLTLPFTGSQRYSPYPVDVDIVTAYKLGGWNTTIPLKKPVKVPVLHCECEGSRIHDLLQTFEDIGGLGTGICMVKILGIPIGKAICSVVATILAPILAIALGIAWFKADDGNADDARTGGLPGELQVGNIVVVTGRWSYDAGHEGWNELHPVKSIQKISESLYGITPFTADFVKRWCTLTSEVPPPNRDGAGAAPATMTPAQQETWDNQRDPGHRWNTHPLLDGCEPVTQPDGPVIR